MNQLEVEVRFVNNDFIAIVMLVVGAIVVFIVGDNVVFIGAGGLTVVVTVVLIVVVISLVVFGGGGGKVVVAWVLPELGEAENTPASKSTTSVIIATITKSTHASIMHIFLFCHHIFRFNFFEDLAKDSDYK